VLAYILAALILLVSSITAKGATVLMVKQVEDGPIHTRPSSQLSLSPTNLPFCNTRTATSQWVQDSIGRKFEVLRPTAFTPNLLQVEFGCDALTQESLAVPECSVRRVQERVAWIWAIGLVFSLPQLFVFGRSLRKFLFKFIRFPRLSHFTFVLVMEALHTAGLATLALVALPELDSVQAVMLTARWRPPPLSLPRPSLATLPACLLLLSRLQEDNTRRRWAVGRARSPSPPGKSPGRPWPPTSWPCWPSSLARCSGRWSRWRPTWPPTLPRPSPPAPRPCT
jgi:hypothetical protein